MSINPENITTVRVDQLANLGVTLESLFPHTVGNQLTSSPISDLVTLVANAIETTEALGFLPISVTDGQQLPDIPTTPGFFLAGAGTYLNVNGFPNLVCTENLNVIMTVDDHWEIAVQIAVNPLTGSVQSVTGSAVDNTDPLNPVINLSSTTPDLQAVTDENLNVDGYAETTNGIQASKLKADGLLVEGGVYYSDSFSDTIFNLLYLPGVGIYVQDDLAENVVTLNQNGTINFVKNSILTELEPTSTTPRLLFLPDKNGILATTDDITGGGYTVVSSNQTAVNDTNYTVVANATFTDPSPTEGKGYVVYVRNGTATIGGTGYAVGSLVFRIYHSGAWSTREYKSNLTIDATPTNGSANAVQSDGVFDALALKSDVNRSETFIFSKANGTFGSHTGNTTETVILTSTITGGVFEIGDWMNLMYDFSVTGTAGTKTIRFRAGTTGTTADVLIGSAFFTAGVLDFGWSRERLQFKTGNILSGIANNYTAQGFDIVGNTAAKQSTSLNPSNNWILSVTVQLANSADTVSCDGYVISRVKSF